MPSSIRLNLEDLATVFSIDSTPSTPSQIMSSKKKQNVTTLLDISRANNIGMVFLLVNLLHLLDVNDSYYACPHKVGPTWNSESIVGVG